MFRRIPLGALCLGAGSVLTVVGIGAYVLDYAALNIFGFFYGIPLVLGGIALKITELRPVPFSEPTPPDVLALREQQATATQTQILNDVTRFRYGQKAHLDSSLKFLGLSPTDEDRPTLIGLRESNADGRYELTLEFDSPFIPLDTWQKKLEKMTNFFGPGVRVELAQPEAERVDVSIIAISTSTPTPAVS
jgi:hypothetical protein